MSPQQPGTPDLDALMRHDEGCFPTNHACDCTRDARLAAALRERDERIKALTDEVRGYEAYKRNIDDALNSGDGVYRP